MTTPTKAFAKALAYHDGSEKDRWKEAEAVYVALTENKDLTIRDYCVLAEGDYSGEQKYSNRLKAVAFRRVAIHKYEAELEQLEQGGVWNISYFSEVGRYWSNGAEMSDCIELLQSCVYTENDTVKRHGVRWLAAKISAVIDPPPDWPSRTAKLVVALERYISPDEMLGAPTMFTKHAIPLIRTLISLLKDAVK